MGAGRRAARAPSRSIPNLVETVKSYAGHKRSTFDEVTEARATAQRATTVEHEIEERSRSAPQVDFSQASAPSG